jgi:hypothetical protein
MGTKTKKQTVNTVVESQTIETMSNQIDQTMEIEVTIVKQLGRPLNPNSARQQRLAEMEARRVNGEVRKGRPVNPDSARQAKLAGRTTEGTGVKGRPVNFESARQKKLAEMEAKRANGGLKRGRPAGQGKKVEEVKSNLKKRYKVVINDGETESNYTKSFASPKSAVKEMKEIGVTNFKLVEFAVTAE